MKDSGRTEKDTALGLKPVVVGYIGVNGHKVLKEDMEFDNLILQQPNTKERGPTDYKMVMDRKHMLMMVRIL